ncbi:MAG: zinc ribbon domain-containing protein [Deltaproteobacteria bacterium]|nr:zinc ribbon domain-containing protein [Deltaproteobacteria bacterium]
MKPIPCPKCDKDNDCDAEFCDACGSPLRDAKCASCGTTNKPDSSFCKKCGSKLESAGSAGSP